VLLVEPTSLIGGEGLMAGWFEAVGANCGGRAKVSGGG
jgi:hypothetical protein